MQKPIKIFVYDDLHITVPSLLDSLGKNDLSRHFTTPYFTFTTDHQEADFFLLPHSVDPLFQKIGAKACRAFLTALPHYNAHRKQHIFFMFDDQNLPLGLPSIIYRYTHDRHLQEPNSITLPTLINHGNTLYKKPTELAYHVSFTGALTTHFCRLQMIIPFLKPAEQKEFEKILPLINNLQNAQSEPEHYTALTEKIKPKMAKIFPRIAKSRGVTYYLDLTVNQFNLLPEDDRQHLFTKQVEIIQNSLFVLAPRGHGSYSIRFFEILAAGRIPILISDNYLPPLPWLIDYDDFIFRIPQNQLLNIRQIIAGFNSNNSLSELNRRCLKGHNVWEKYFAPQQFPTFLFHTLNEVKKHNYNLNKIRIRP